MFALLFLSPFLVTTIKAATTDEPVSGKAELAEMVNHVNEQLFSYLSEKEPENNLVISPFSIGIALAMLYQGTAGNSKRQLRRALNLPGKEGIDKLEEEVASILDKYTNHHHNITIRMGNAVFLNTGFTPKEKFISLIEGVYSSEVHQLQENTSKVDTVNEWISDRTEGKIPNFLSEGSITEETQMLLLNAIYMYGDWQYPFDKDFTSTMRFYLEGEPRRYVATSFMDLEETLQTAHVSDMMDVIWLPYHQTNYSMVLYLPHQNVSVHQLVNEVLQNENRSISELRTTATRSKVNLQMPRFQLNTKNSLVEALEYFNVTEIFDERTANLSKISDRNIHVGDIQHSAAVKVDENGSEAVAVTSITLDLRTSVNGPVKLIRLDKPFIFSIMDDEGLVLFTGKVMNPTRKTPLLDNEPIELEDIEDDTILVVRKPSPSEPIASNNRHQLPGDKQRSTGEESEKLKPEEPKEPEELEEPIEPARPTVTISCAGASTNEDVAGFANCEKKCTDPKMYGLCMYNCWSKHCLHA